MLLKHNVTNTVCYRQKNVTARMIQLQKISSLSYDEDVDWEKYIVHA